LIDAKLNANEHMVNKSR